MRLESISQLYTIFQQHPVVTTDSRNVVAGSIFFALKGDRFNANAYALSALEQGCAYAVIDEQCYEQDDRFLLVDDVLLTLQKLANFHRRHLGTPVIGITGTNGKTTTKELIASVLKQKYRILYTQGNLNNHIGVPLTLLKLNATHEMAVVEMGASHPGEIALLCDIAAPDYGIITNVGKAHLEGFGSFEGVKNTKAELYRYIAENGKCIFLNEKNDYLCDMARKAGVADRAVAYTKGQMVSSSPFLELNCEVDGQEIFVKTNLIGSYNTENVLAAVTIGNYFGIPVEQIKSGLEGYVPQNNRSQFVETGKNRLIVDAYNANPTSMAMAVKNFSQIEAAKKLLILGDMLELGDQSEGEHQKIVDLLASEGLDEALFVGSQFMKSNHKNQAFKDIDSLAAYLQEKNYKGYYILIKGSRGIRLEKVIELL